MSTDAAGHRQLRLVHLQPGAVPRRAGAEVRVVRNDEITRRRDRRAGARAHRDLARARARPNEAGISLEVIDALAGKMPILGVCLGHQAIGQAFGGKVVRAARGHARQDLADPPRRAGASSPGCPTRSRRPAITRWWSSGRACPTCLEITRQDAEDEEIMGVRHKTLPVEGVQFHPESFLTHGGQGAAAQLPRAARAAVSGSALHAIDRSTEALGARRRAPRSDRRRDGRRGGRDHGRRGDAGADRRAADGAAHEGRDRRRGGRRGAGDAGAHAARPGRRRRSCVDTCGTGGDGSRHGQRLDAGGAHGGRLRA